MRLKLFILFVFIWAAMPGPAMAEDPLPQPEQENALRQSAEASALQSAAETAFLTTNQIRGFEILNEIEKTFPDYYEANRVRFLLLEVHALNQMGQHPEAAQKLSLIHDLMQKGFPVGVIERDFFQAKAADYQKLGWLDADYRAAREPIRKPGAPSKKKNFLGYTIGSLLILPIFFIIVFYSRKKRLQRVKAIMKR
ncbi:MAG: hypothetical protein M0Q48_05555 [Verrucomicrobia bacterium]|nr:hypothetical protein [Verrucomicrobiota bacterium]